MKTPIEPNEIRKGDHLRWEDESDDLTPGRVLVVEYRASHDEHSQFRDGQHFLLDRPEPAVALPTEPTLGWASNRHGPKLGAAGHPGYSPTLRNDPGHHVRYVGGGFDPHSLIEAFTPATAVPTEALEKLRESVVEWSPITPHGHAINDFLAAVDHANGAKS